MVRLNITNMLIQRTFYGITDLPIAEELKSMVKKNYSYLWLQGILSNGPLSRLIHITCALDEYKLVLLVLRKNINNSSYHLYRVLVLKQNRTFFNQNQSHDWLDFNKFLFWEWYSKLIGQFRKQKVVKVHGLTYKKTIRNSLVPFF